MSQWLLVVTLFILFGLQVGCGDQRSAESRSPAPNEQVITHPLARMKVNEVLRIHEQLLLAQQSTAPAHWPTLSGYKLHQITVEQLGLHHDLAETDMDRRLLLRLHALLMDEKFRVYLLIDAKFVIQEMKYEFYRGNL